MPPLFLFSTGGLVKREKSVKARVTEKELRTITEAAQRRGLSPAAFVRMMALQNARPELGPMARFGAVAAEVR